MSKKETATKSAVNAEPVFELSDVARAISEASQNSLQFKEGGIAKHETKDTYADALAAAGLDIKVRKQYQSFDNSFAAGQLHALGVKGAPVLAANPNLQNVTLDVRCGNDRLDIAIDREGQVQAAWTKKGGNTSGSEFGKTSAHISLLVRRALGAE